MDFHGFQEMIRDFQVILKILGGFKEWFESLTSYLLDVCNM